MNPNKPKRTIEKRLDDIDAQLKKIRQQLDYVIAHLTADVEAEGFEQAEYEVEMEKAEEAFAAKQALEFAAWSKDEETKGRPRKELTFENFVKETDDGEGNGGQQCIRSPAPRSASNAGSPAGKRPSELSSASASSLDSSHR